MRFSAHLPEPSIPTAEMVPNGRRRDGKATTSRNGRPVRALRLPSCVQKGRRSTARLRPPHRASVLRPLPLAGTGKKVALASRSDSPGLPIAGREGPLASPRRPAARMRVRSWSCRDQYQWRSGRGLSSRITSRGGPAPIPCGPGTQPSIGDRSSWASSKAQGRQVR